jgi:ribosomal protein S6--L-glutamate ligase
MHFTRRVVAIEGRLRGCRNVVTLGVRTHFDDYTADEQALIRQADTVYYPTSFYAELLSAAGKRIFPSLRTYAFAQDKVKQTALFRLLDIPHPRTRVFYGRQRSGIFRAFDTPFVAKVARGSARGHGVRLIRTADDLEDYCARNRVAYVQEYLPHDRDVRVVVIGNAVAHAYWRVAAPGEFRTNVALGGRVLLEPVPADAQELALRTARLCGWDDAGIDLCRRGEGWVVLEANMKYGREGFRQAGIDYVRLMERMIENHDI